MENRTLIIVMGAMGAFLIGAFLAITFLVPGDKTTMYAGLAAVAGLFIPHLMTLKSSTDNAVRLKKVDEKVEETKAEVKETKVEVAHTAEVAHHAAAQVSANTDKLATIAGDIDGRLAQRMAESMDKARQLGRKEGEQSERDRHGSG